MLPAQAGVPSCGHGSSRGGLLSHGAVGSPGPVGKLIGQVRAVSPEPSLAWPAVLPGIMLVLVPGVFSVLVGSCHLRNPERVGVARD